MRHLPIRYHRPVSLLILYWVTFILFPFQGEAQSPYELSLAKELPLLSVGAAGTTASILLRDRNEPLTAEDLGKLNASDIFAIDQAATGFYGENARIASDITLTTSYFLPLAILGFQDGRKDAGTIGVMLAETVLLNEAITGITKALVKRPRPFTYNQDVPENIRTASASNFSFFSGHTSYTAALSFFTAKVISDLSDDATTKVLVWTGAALLPAATGYFRYKAGMHFPTDVITGYLVGASVGYLIPQLHKTKPEEKGNQNLQSQFVLSPPMVRLVFVF